MNNITLIILAIIFWVPITVVVMYSAYLLYITGAVILMGVAYFVASIGDGIKKLLRIR
jgi:hypothetical protein